MSDETRLDDEVTAEHPAVAAAAFTPLPHQAAFIESDEPSMLLETRAGGGKTTALLRAAARDIYRPDYCGALLVARHEQLPGLLRATIEVFFDLEGFYRHVDLAWTFPSGARIWLLSGDRVAALQGTHLQFLGIEHIDEFPYDQLVKATSRLRTRSATHQPRLRGTRALDQARERLFG